MSESKSGTLGVAGVVGIVFVTLKLCGVINWSWWLVALPFYWWFALVAVLFVVFSLVGA